jgi:hypothetical protein
MLHGNATDLYLNNEDSTIWLEDESNRKQGGRKTNQMNLQAKAKEDHKKLSTVTCFFA